MNRADWQIRAVALLVAVTLVKVLIAVTFPLGVDEAYAIAAARDFSLSFYDHPPLGFWAPVASAQIFGESALAYRMPFLLCGAATGWLLYLIGHHLAGPKAGFYSLVLFAIAPHMALGSGVFVLPDGPLNLGSGLTAYALVKMAGHVRPSLKHWALGGLGLAIAFGSKYQAGLIPFGVLSFMLLTPGRWRWALQPGFWLAAAIAVLGVAPVLIWNISQDWVSFAFHGARTARTVQLANFAAMAAGQLVYLLPATLAAALILSKRALRGAPGPRSLAHLALWPIVAFNAIYLFSDASFPHWTMPGFVFALPLVGVWLAQAGSRLFLWASYGFGTVVWAVIAVLMVHVPTGIFAPRDGFANWDQTQAMFNWSGLEPALRLTAGYDGSQIIVVDSWIEAGQIGTGLAMGGADPVLLVRHTPHHFALTQPPDLTGQALYLVPDRLDHVDTEAALAVAQSLDPNAEQLGTVALNRGGRAYAGVAVISLTLP